MEQGNPWEGETMLVIAIVFSPVLVTMALSVVAVATQAVAGMGGAR